MFGKLFGVVGLIMILGTLIGCHDKPQKNPAPAPPPQEIGRIRVLPEKPPKAPTEPVPAIVAGEDETVFVGDEMFSLHSRTDFCHARRRDGIYSREDNHGRHTISAKADEVAGSVIEVQNQSTKRALIKRGPGSGVFHVVEGGEIKSLDFLEPGHSEAWQVREGITANTLVYPSDILDNALVSASFTEPLYEFVTMPLKDLPVDNGIEWELRYICTTDDQPVHIGAQQLSSKEGEDEENLQSLERLTRVTETVIPLIYRIVPKIGSEDLHYRLKRISTEYHKLGLWFDKLPTEEKLSLMDSLGPGAAKLILLAVEPDQLTRILTGLDWARDILIANPAWENPWLHNDAEVVVTFYGMSHNDLLWRLYWARRGEPVFEKAKKIMQAEMVV